MNEKFTKADILALLDSLKCKKNTAPHEQSHNATIEMVKDAVMQMKGEEE